MCYLHRAASLPGVGSTGAGVVPPAHGFTRHDPAAFRQWSRGCPLRTRRAAFRAAPAGPPNQCSAITYLAIVIYQGLSLILNATAPGIMYHSTSANSTFIAELPGHAIPLRTPGNELIGTRPLQGRFHQHIAAGRERQHGRHPESDRAECRRKVCRQIAVQSHGTISSIRRRFRARDRLMAQLLRQPHWKALDTSFISRLMAAVRFPAWRRPSCVANDAAVQSVRFSRRPSSPVIIPPSFVPQSSRGVHRPTGRTRSVSATSRRRELRRAASSAPRTPFILSTTPVSRSAS